MDDVRRWPSTRYNHEEQAHHQRSHFLSSGPCTLPWCDLYQVNSGDVSATFVNRPVVGGVYSLLARDLPVKPLGATSNLTNSAMALSVPITILLVSVLSHDVAHSLIQLLDLHFSCNLFIWYNTLSIL
jgi:hypothetical protein